MVFRDRRPSRHRAASDESTSVGSEDDLESYLAALSDQGGDSAPGAEEARTGPAGGAEPGSAGGGGSGAEGRAELSGPAGAATLFQLRLPGSRAEQLRQLAAARGVEPRALITEWVLDRLDAERADGASRSDARATTGRDGARHSGRRAARRARASAEPDRPFAAPAGELEAPTPRDPFAGAAAGELDAGSPANPFAAAPAAGLDVPPSAAPLGAPPAAGLDVPPSAAPLGAPPAAELDAPTPASVGAEPCAPSAGGALDPLAAAGDLLPGGARGTYHSFSLAGMAEGDLGSSEHPTPPRRRTSRRAGEQALPSGRGTGSPAAPNTSGGRRPSDHLAPMPASPSFGWPGAGDPLSPRSTPAPPEVAPLSASDAPDPASGGGPRSQPAARPHALPGALTPLADSLTPLLGSRAAHRSGTDPAGGRGSAGHPARSGFADRFRQQPPPATGDRLDERPASRGESTTAADRSRSAHRPSPADSMTPLADSLAAALGARARWEDNRSPFAGSPAAPGEASTPFRAIPGAPPHAGTTPADAMERPAWSPESLPGFPLGASGTGTAGGGPGTPRTASGDAAQRGTGHGDAGPRGAGHDAGRRHAPHSDAARRGAGGDAGPVRSGGAGLGGSPEPEPDERESRDSRGQVVPIFRAGSELPNPDEHRGPRHRAPEPVTSLLTRRKF